MRSSDTFCIDGDELQFASPSRRDGVPADVEAESRRYGVHLQRTMGKLLRLYGCATRARALVVKNRVTHTRESRRRARKCTHTHIVGGKIADPTTLASCFAPAADPSVQAAGERGNLSCSAPQVLLPGIYGECPRAAAGIADRPLARDEARGDSDEHHKYSAGVRPRDKLAGRRVTGLRPGAGSHVCEIQAAP